MTRPKINPDAGDAGVQEICNITPAVFPTIANENQGKLPDLLPPHALKVSRVAEESERTRLIDMAIEIGGAQ